MKISFSLNWLKKGRPPASSFKHPGAYELFSEYTARIKKFVPLEVTGHANKREPGQKIWICERGTPGKAVNSRELARQLQKTLESGARELKIIIGGPDGIAAAETAALDPEFMWSFGPMTLPHELAAVVAAEQIYRAFSIINGLPYHIGH